MTPARTAAARTLRVSRVTPPAPRALHASARRRAVEDSPLSHNTAPKRSPWPVIIGLTAVTGGAYAYYISTEDNRLSKEKRELESKTAHVGPMAEDVKLRAQEAASDARSRSAAGARDVRDSAQAKLESARDGANRTYEDAKSKVNGAVSSASSSSQSVADDAKAATKQNADAAKSGWFSWLGWGKAKAADVVDQASHVADDLKRKANETEEQFSRRWEDAKSLAKAKGEEISQKAGETEEEYRIRIARALARKDKP